MIPCSSSGADPGTFTSECPVTRSTQRRRRSVSSNRYPPGGLPGIAAFKSMQPPTGARWDVSPEDRLDELGDSSTFQRTPHAISHANSRPDIDDRGLLLSVLFSAKKELTPKSLFCLVFHDCGVAAAGCRRSVPHAPAT